MGILEVVYIYVGKGRGKSGAHCRSSYLEELFFIELEVVLC